MITSTKNPLQTTAIYETSFHLPKQSDAADLDSLIVKNLMVMKGVLHQAGPLIRVGKSHIEGYDHYQVIYLFESFEAACEYIKNPKLGGEQAKNAFTKAYGDVAKERRRSLNGVPC